MKIARLKPIQNAETIPLIAVPSLTIENFSEEILSTVKNGGRIASLFALPSDNGGADLFCLLALDREGKLFLLSSKVQTEYLALTPFCPMAHLFEREIFEETGIIPKGHPWLKPLRSHGKESLLPFEVKGDQIHEVSVGPVHAGIIEPGHFRFHCNGEKVLFLEISLGYQHRGVERALIGGPNPRTLHYMETLAGDTTIGHTLAYLTLLESLGSSEVTPRAHALRAIALELERLANHIGDLGALAGDVGYLPTMSYCGRLRGELLNMTALIAGNRFGRRLLTAGGVRWDMDCSTASELLSRLNEIGTHLESAVNLLWSTPSVMARFEETGKLNAEDCRLLGLVGPVARASGLDRDIRKDHPLGMYRFAFLPTVTCDSGDVFARAYVRWLEIQRSETFLLEQLENLPEGSISTSLSPLQPSSISLSLVEGWRGEICHVAITDEKGMFKKYKVVDPSFHNWFGLSYAMRNQEISDFPLCNKSFNLSYCGHDL